MLAVLAAVTEVRNAEIFAEINVEIFAKINTKILTKYVDIYRNTS